MKRRFNLSAVAAFVVFVLVGCGGDDDDATGQRTIAIGLLAPLDAGLTQFGRGIRNSQQLAVDEAVEADLLPGWELQILAVDDSSDPDVGSSDAPAAHPLLHEAVNIDGAEN